MNEPTLVWAIGNIESQKNLEERGFNGNTPVLMAALQGDLPTVARLIELGADIHTVNNDKNGILFNSVYANSPELIRFLVEHGVDVNAMNDDEVTPLMYAASAGRGACVQTLLEMGANARLVNRDGMVAVDFATTKEILSMLRRA